ncbi:hypothetical protein F7734_13515 [Scytonema sp. UIC 10036]|uniref:hypothetical protein n=1 Tax=Scytonema sp. UIC 10036 TaxID=2304196 RepID=UPI0012DA26C3|nr:hypothetical protein [Scytonema sp. UIC 10036]MUG93391.1 hypothetical protein [Scytonema sp. UIC 10036]
MKRIPLLSFSACLAILGASLLSNTQYTPAEPAPIFTPILNDIRNQLPQGTEMRLPSTLPTLNWSLISKAFSELPVDGKIYPYVGSTKEAIEVRLALTPNCGSSPKPNECTIGGLSVFKSRKPKYWPPKGENITPVDLGNGIRGFYLTRGSGHNTLRYVFWEQNGLQFALGTAAFVMSQQELIDTAISAANEPPITSAN